MAELFANDVATVLSVGCDADDVTIGVAVAAPVALQGGQFRIAIDAELLLVTAGASTTTWTVTRGVEGTTAAAHASGAAVAHVLTAASLAAIGAGTPIASLPAVTVPATTDLFVVDQGGTTKQVAGALVTPLDDVIGPIHSVWSGGATAALTINRVYLFRFSVRRPQAITKAVYVVSTQSGNMCLGIYSAAGALLATTGSFVMAGAGSRQQALTAGITLLPGQFYWAGVQVDNTTARLWGPPLSGTQSGLYGTTLGVPIAHYAEGGAFPLPATVDLSAPAGMAGGSMAPAVLFR